MAIMEIPAHVTEACHAAYRTWTCLWEGGSVRELHEVRPTSPGDQARFDRDRGL